MQRAEQRLEHLIENLIEFSLFARGDLTLQYEDVNLSEVFDEVLKEYITKANIKNISLISDIPKKIPIVHADQQKIAWVISQFLDNALKFTESGGQVRLGAHSDGQFVSIYVYDTGIGISKDLIDDIFEPFHQLDSSATRRYQGTGLGLAMANKIIQAHGSNISVRSKVGEGSYIEFKLSVHNPSL
jgi:signal transduction histidine kinase